MSYTGDGLPILGIAQARIFHCDKPRIVVVAGRRLGKTTYAGVRIARALMRKRMAEARYIAPTYKQAKEIFWKPIKRIIPPAYVAKIHEGDLTVTLHNGSTLKLLGAEDPSSLRGPGLDDAIFDEFADIAPETWSEVIEPSLSDREGAACFLGTPKGYNHFYDLYQQGLSDDPAFADWASFTFTTAQGGQVKKSIIDRARATLDLRVFRQEYEASFETLQGRVYANFLRQAWPKGNIDPSILDLGGPLVVGMDFNVHPMSAVVMQEVNGWPQVLREVILPTSNTEEMAQTLRALYPNRKIEVCPDASGKNRSTASPQGQTNFTILQQYGFTVNARNANPAVIDRINAVQSALLSGSGLRRITIHPRHAPTLVKALEGLQWKEGTTTVDKTSGLDHVADAFGYPIFQKWNLLYNLLPRSTPSSGAIHSPFAA